MVEQCNPKTTNAIPVRDDRALICTDDDEIQCTSKFLACIISFPGLILYLVASVIGIFCVVKLS